MFGVPTYLNKKFKKMLSKILKIFATNFEILFVKNSFNFFTEKNDNFIAKKKKSSKNLENLNR